MAITIEDIEALRRKLAELPRHQAREVSKQEAIALLATELGSARRRGYSPDELAQLLSERGVAINAATLRGYLRKNRRNRGRRAAKPSTVGAKDASKAQPARSESAPTPAAAPPQPTAGARSAPTIAKEPLATPSREAASPLGTKDVSRGALRKGQERGPQADTSSRRVSGRTATATACRGRCATSGGAGLPVARRRRYQRRGASARTAHRHRGPTTSRQWPRAGGGAPPASP